MARDAETVLLTSEFQGMQAEEVQIVGDSPVHLIPAADMRGHFTGADQDFAARGQDGAEGSKQPAKGGNVREDVDEGNNVETFSCAKLLERDFEDFAAGHAPGKGRGTGVKLDPRPAARTIVREELEKATRAAANVEK